MNIIIHALNRSVIPQKNCPLISTRIWRLSNFLCGVTGHGFLQKV